MNGMIPLWNFNSKALIVTVHSCIKNERALKCKPCIYETVCKHCIIQTYLDLEMAQALDAHVLFSVRLQIQALKPWIFY